jgi:hypothetical protein
MEKVNSIPQTSEISFSSEISPNNKVKNRRKITLIAGAIILTLASGAGGFILAKNLSISSKKNQSQEAKPTVLPNNISVEKPICASLDLPEHKVVDNFSIDLDKDKENEIVRIYAPHIIDSCESDLPIAVKIFSKPTDYDEENCYKEEFTYPETLSPISDGFNDKRYNSYESAQVVKNFWPEGEDAILVLAKLNFCGSGSRRQLLLFTYQNGKYLKIDGPIFYDLASYFLSSPPEGEAILVVQGKREEGIYLDSHRYTFILYKWDGQEYKKTELGTTKNKYDPTDENFKAILQNIKITFQNEPEKLPLEIEKL